MVHSFTSRCSKCISTAQARRNCWARVGAFLDCALVVAPHAFSDLVVTFHGTRKKSLVFWWSNVNFRGRRRGSEWLYFDVQIAWQLQHFGHGGGLRRAMISQQVSRSKTLNIFNRALILLQHGLLGSMRLTVDAWHLCSFMSSHTRR